MDLLTVDVGAIHVKIMRRDRKTPGSFKPDPKLTPNLKQDSSPTA